MAIKLKEVNKNETAKVRERGYGCFTDEHDGHTLL